MKQIEDKQIRLRVLVGDDQIGVQSSLHQKSFLRSYGHLADFDFADKADDFIKKAKEDKYDALLIDLNWEEADNEKEYKTGFRVLEAVKNYAKIRVLHTSDETALQKGYTYGATHCIEKHRSASYLEKILKN